LGYHIGYTLAKKRWNAAPNGHDCNSRTAGHWLRPNGSRLSCGRTARGRKEVEPQTKRLASEAT